MALVQIYWEIHWAEIDPEIEGRLKGQEGGDFEFPDRRLHLGRAMDDQGSVFAQVWGARLLAMPGALPITADPLDVEGLVWPGRDKPINNDVARGLGVADYVYVDDLVLSTYEGRQGFRVYPESGSVSHGTQWSVGYCDRVGRNIIRLETKKLYEGAPAAVVRHWHKFAVRGPLFAALPVGRDRPNIAKRAKSVTYALVRLGEVLSELPEEFVGLRRRALDHYGWWTSEVVEPVSRHVPLASSNRRQFP